MGRTYLLAITIFLLQLSTAHAQQWEWARSFEVPVQILTTLPNADPAGNFYVFGSYHHSITIDNHSLYEYGQHSFLAKFDSTGSCVWLEKMSDSLRAIHSDRYGNIYIIRYFNGSTQVGNFTLVTQGGAGFCLIKYKPDLTIEWVKQGETYSALQQFSIAIDNNQDVIISAAFSDSLYYDNHWAPVIARDNTFLAKVSGSGSVIWRTSIGNSLIQNIRVDRNNDLVFVAPLYDTAYFGNITVPYYEEYPGRYYLAKYSSNGHPVWVNEMWTAHYDHPPVFDFDSNSRSTVSLTLILLSQSILLS